MPMKHLTWLLLGPLFVCPLHAQEDKVPWVKLNLEPAAAPVPALKYQLLPEVRDLKPGNAALLYQRAHAPEWFNVFLRHPDYAMSSEWLEWPLAKFPVDKARGLLPRSALQEVDLAARREYCDWEMTERLRQDGPNLTIPDVQGFRHYGYLLALRARLEMLDKKYDKAVYTLQTGYALSRHVGDQPILISGLVGLAIGQLMTNEVENLIQQPGAPNLFWALTDLPRPLLDLRRAFQGERLMVDSIFPEIRQALSDPKHPPLTPAQIQAGLNRVAALEGQGVRGQLLAAAFAVQVHKEASQYLRGQGFTAAQVEALPVTQVALMYALAEYDHSYEDMRKWTSLPYWEALPGLREAQQRLGQLKKSQPARAALAATLVPATFRVILARARLDRRLAALRVVEAVRLYAAAHDGKLPASLNDVRDVPIPVDPLTGQPFDYRLEGGRARLSGPAPPGEAAQAHYLVRYEITMRGSKQE